MVVQKPSWKIWWSESQWEGWHPIDDLENKTSSKPPTSISITNEPRPKNHTLRIYHCYNSSDTIVIMNHILVSIESTRIGLHQSLSSNKKPVSFHIRTKKWVVNPSLNLYNMVSLVNPTVPNLARHGWYLLVNRTLPEVVYDLPSGKLTCWPWKWPIYSGN